MKRVPDDIMARFQEEAASKRHLLELGKLRVDPPAGTQPVRQKLEAGASAQGNKG